MSEVEVWAGGVNSWECDGQAHLGVRFHAAKAGLGLAGLAARLGMRETFSPRAKYILRVREQYGRFLSEAVAGASLSIDGGVLEMGDSDARMLLILRRPSGDPVSAFQLVVDHVRAAEGDPAPWPDSVREQAKALQVDPPPYAVPRTLDLAPVKTTASLERAMALGLRRIALTVIRPEECDLFGRLRMDALMGLIGDAMPRLTARKVGGRLGGAAVEYRLVLFDHPRVGDWIELRSGVAESTSRHQRTIHWMFEPDGGLRGVATNVGLSFDLETRSFVALSDEEVAASQSIVTPGLAL